MPRVLRLECDFEDGQPATAFVIKPQGRPGREVLMCDQHAATVSVIQAWTAGTPINAPDRQPVSPPPRREVGGLSPDRIAQNTRHNE